MNGPDPMDTDRLPWRPRDPRRQCGDRVTVAGSSWVCDRQAGHGGRHRVDGKADDGRRVRTEWRDGDA